MQCIKQSDLHSKKPMNAYNTYPHRDFARLSPPAQVRRIAGVLVKVFDPKRGRNDVTGLRGHGEMNGVLQNAFIRDPLSEAEVKVMFSDFYLAPAEFQGGFIALEAVEENDIVWKAQTSTRQPVPPKVEIRSRARILHLIPARDYAGPSSLPADYNHSTAPGDFRLEHPSSAASSAPSKSGSAPTRRAPGAPTTASTSSTPPPHTSDPMLAVCRLAHLARLTVESMTASVHQASVNGAAVQVGAELFQALTTSAFVQLTKDGVHHGISAESMGYSVPAAPITPERPNLERLQRLIGQYGQAPVMMMLAANGLKVGDQGVAGLSEEAISGFFAAIPPNIFEEAA